MTTNRKGKASFTVPINQDLSGQFITATATSHDPADVTKRLDTSEFSKALAASPA